MNLDWYHVFIAAVLVLWMLSTPRDRNAARIVLIASLASEGIVDGITHQIHGAWKLAIPGAVEVLTILALLQWARNRTGYTQAGLLVFAWLAHLLCYLDCLLKTDLVYSRYESIIQWVAVGQIIAFHETISHSIGACRDGIAALWGGGIRGLRNASVGAGTVHCEGEAVVQSARSTQEND